LKLQLILSALADDPKLDEDSYDNYSRDFKDGTTDFLRMIHFSLDKLGTTLGKLRKEDEEILQKKAQYKDEKKGKEEEREGGRKERVAGICRYNCDCSRWNYRLGRGARYCLVQGARGCECLENRAVRNDDGM
jgi:hypothetical protein